MAVTYDGVTYYYATNLQGDIVAILDSAGTAVVKYSYDAWGKPLTTSGAMATTLGVHNPLRYRGYVYDEETALYYLQSRYYDPVLGRFINADVYVCTGDGIIGHNMFAYCNGNPVNIDDPDGCSALAISAGGALMGSLGSGLLAGTWVTAVSNIWNPIGWAVATVAVVVIVAAVGHEISEQVKFSKNNDVDPYARPGQKKQGRERKNKSRQNPNWVPRSKPKPPKKHTPGRDHRRYMVK